MEMVVNGIQVAGWVRVPGVSQFNGTIICAASTIPGTVCYPVCGILLIGFRKSGNACRAGRISEESGRKIKLFFPSIPKGSQYLTKGGKSKGFALIRGV